MRVAPAIALSLAATLTVEGQAPFVPVGVIDDRPGETNRETVDEFRKLRFTVIARRDAAGVGSIRVDAIPPLGAPASARPIPVSVGGLAILKVEDDWTANRVRREAWTTIGRGSRGVVFDSWTRLRHNASALSGAAAFADVVTRNAALFAPLSPSSRDVKIDPPSAAVFARFVESTRAIVLVVANLTDREQRVTLQFGPDTPEAIWQNMESGAMVNFVAAPQGPTYSRSLAPDDVVVLMIQKQ